MKNVDDMGRLLFAGVSITEIDGQWYTPVFIDGAQVLYDSDTVVAAVRAMMGQRSSLSSSARYEGIEDVLALSDLYDLDHCARLVVSGYTAAELLEAHKHGIDLELYTSLRDGK